MALTPEMTRRLTLVRYLFQVGFDQSKRGEPLAALSILPLHDAVELFLQAALEHVGGELGSKKDFLGFWSALSDKGVTLSRKGSMARFNEARTALKHRGTLPAHVHVEDFRGIVSGFLEESFPIVFGKTFEDISLSGLVRDDEVRRLLGIAEVDIGSQEYAKSMESTILAFRLTLETYVYGQQGDDPDQRLFHPGSAQSHRIRRHMPRIAFEGSAVADAVNDVVSDFDDAIDDMRKQFGETVTVIAHNLDFDGYRYLKTYSPVVHRFAGGGSRIEWVKPRERVTARISKRCLAFVTDTALRLEGEGQRPDADGSPS